MSKHRFADLLPVGPTRGEVWVDGAPLWLWLAIEVPRRILALRDDGDRQDAARTAALALLEANDGARFTRDEWGLVAGGLAALSFAPGGVSWQGQRWESDAVIALWGDPEAQRTAVVHA